LQLAKHQYHALEDADALVLVTEWKPFRHPDFKAMKNLMRLPVIFDGRNQYEPQLMQLEGFDYWGIGRRGAAPAVAVKAALPLAAGAGKQF
jgi:UDPglucose 6-dehydrogenase